MNRALFVVFAWGVGLLVPVWSQTATVKPTESIATEGGVPLMKDLPLIGGLFQNRAGEATRWIQLGKVGSSSAPGSQELDLATRYLMQRLREDVPELREVVFEVRTVRRTSDGKTFDKEGEEGLRLAGVPVAVERGVHLVQQYLLARDQYLIEARVEILACEPRTTSKEASTFAISTPEKRDARRKVLQAIPNASVISAPSLLVISGQRAQVTVVNTTAYIKDHEIKMVGTHLIADPIIDTFSEGVFLDLECLLEPAGAGVLMNGKVRLVNAARPIREFKTSLADSNHEVTIQMPEIRESGITFEEVAIPFLGQEAVLVIEGLVLPSQGDAADSTPVEIWCTFRPRPAAATNEGVVIGRDQSSGQVFVNFPESVVGADPAANAPAKVKFTRDGADQGRGERTGGWHMSGLSDTDRFRRVAIYRVTSGAAAEGDLVKTDG